MYYVSTNLVDLPEMVIFSMGLPSMLVFDGDPDFAPFPASIWRKFWSAGLLEHIARHYEKNRAKRSRLSDYIGL